MLAIITAFRARHLARDWDYHVWLLQKALESFLSQTNDSFIVVVVCHEIPKIPQANHPKVRFLEADFSPPQRDNDDMCADKVAKLSVGAEWAISKGCNYIMYTDADDLVNRKISEFVATHSDDTGWYTPSELFYAYGSRWIRKHVLNSMMSGPCVIVKSNTLKFSKTPFSGNWLNIIIENGESRYAELLGKRDRKINTLAAVGHANFRKLMSIEGFLLKPLPFIGNVVINHADSTSQVLGGIGSTLPDRFIRPTIRAYLGRVKRAGLCLPAVRPLTRSLCEEFTISTPDVVPVEYRSLGSIFSRDIFVESTL